MIDKLFESFSKFLTDIATWQPWVKTSLAAVLVLGLASIFFAITYRIVKKGEEFSFLFMKFKSDKRIEEQTQVIEKQNKLFDQLNDDAKQKTQIIKLMDQIYLEISRAISSDTKDIFNQRKSGIFNLVLHGIGTILTKQKANSHRSAIFVPAESGTLKVHEASGFSADGKLYLRLDINDSGAGYSYRTGKPYSDGDIRASGKHFKAHPKSKNLYNSLLCVPIKCGEKIIGVLSVDGQEKNSFTEDDEDYLKYFANALSVLMFFDSIISIQVEEVKSDGESEGKKGLA